MNEGNGGELPPDHTDSFRDEPHAPPPAEIIHPPALASGGGSRRPPPPPPPDEPDEDDGMLRMSFLEHLEELRSRIIKALYGFGVVFLACVFFSNQLFDIILSPGRAAMKATGIPGAGFISIDPMENFQIIWVWTPVVASLFLGSPWILWQVWGFISPGLYQREKKWAIPFVLGTAGLFILGGCFGYFIAFRYGMAFLFGLGKDVGVLPLITIENYFDKFVDVMLGIGLVFELPVLLFMLTLLRVVSPSFLLNHSRYAILGIVIVAAIVTPTPDVFNLMLFAVPMCMLFFLGIFLSYLLVLKREKQRFPWRPFLLWLSIVLAILIAVVAVMVI
ncbi:MAG TPA: twin-arginine translocase subunit TatC, partial [Bryobacteraceae bacterium]